ncbi:MAG: chemotaxis protein CheW [Halioglobus sp.]|nr:chemotaxis protein CheW [Halioglobus sp.]
MAVTALQSLELLERTYVFDGVEAPPFERERMRWVGTSLSIAGVPLLVGEGEIEEIIETPDIAPIPGTKAWMLGVASHRGGLLPIISGDVLFRRRPYAGRVRDYCMVLRRPGFYFGITLSGIERDLHFPIENRLMDQPVDDDFAPFALGGFRHGGKFLAILDIERLVADDELANASATANSANEEQTDD